MKKKIKISVDDGCVSDLRLVELCKKYDIPLTIYLPVEWQRLAYENEYIPLKYYDVVDCLEYAELGSHSISHALLTRINITDATVEIVHSKYLLETLFDTKITEFAPPRGYTNAELTRLTLKHYGDQRLTVGDGLVHIHPNSGANGGVHWRKVVDGIRTKGGILRECWCHSWELAKYDLWDELEEFLSEEKLRTVQETDDNN